MKLVTKLVVLSVVTIVIPMLIIVFFSAFMIYQSTAIRQWEFLENVYSNIEKDLYQTEEDYQKIIKDVASLELLKAKLYVYGKYWTHLTPSLLEYDIDPINDYLEKLARDNDIEVVSIYKRFHDTFTPVAGYGESFYLPTILFKGIVQKQYSHARYRRYPDGIYLDLIYPVFSSGRIVGLVQFMRGYNQKFLDKYSDTYDIDIALVSKNAILLNTKKSTDISIKKLIDEPEDDGRRAFRAGSSSYSGLVIPFKLSEAAVGEIVLYTERADIFARESYFMQRLLALTLLCVMIPVVAFFIKELRLIRSINSLVAVTNDISAGNYKSQVEVHSHDEIGLLGRNFNNMVKVLKKSREDLEAQNLELSMKNSYIDAVFQSLRINIIVLDPEKNIQVVSKNAGSHLELTEEQYGRYFLDVEPFVQKGQMLQKTINNVFEQKKFTRLYSVKFGNISYEIDFYPVVEDDGNISAIVMILNNITERMNMERALIQSDRLASVGKLAAGLAHEINNPMSIILNHVQLLQSNQLTEDEQSRFINRVELEIKRVSKLINNLLRFSREEKLLPERLVLGEFLQEMILLFDPKAAADKVDEFYDGYRIIKQQAECYKVAFKDQHIIFYVSESINDHYIVCERDSLKQIFFNIIKNAFESCGEHDGILRVGLDKVPEGVKIYLSDNGCGISDTELEKVFELFYTKGKPGTGVGLGLSLCRRLMNNMGGEIGLISNKNEGTTITLLFPDREGFCG